MDNEELFKKLGILEDRLNQLEAEKSTPPTGEFNIEKYGLNPNEEQILRLITVGLSDQNAIKIAGLDPSYIASRTRSSLQFATAYADAKELYLEWQEARLKFILPDTWNWVDDLMNANAAKFIEVDSPFARNILQAQTKVALQLLRLNYAKEHRVTHTHEMSPAMLQMQQDNMGILAEHLKNLAAQKSDGTLEANLPQKLIIDVEAQEISPSFTENPINEEGQAKCFECEEFVDDIATHLHLDHDMAISTYLRKYGIEPGTFSNGY
jgi:hypothetical protein